jgi:membrane-bound lytic murein transglycosylase A
MTRAPSASSRISHMRIRPWTAAIVGTLAACASVELPPEPPAPTPTPPAVTAPAPVPAAPVPTPGGPAVERGIARWVAVPYADLPGWDADRVAEVWTALQRGCERPAPAFTALCAEALLRPPPNIDASVRAWLQLHLQPYRVEALDGASEGLVTGYFEPLLEASRTPRPGFQVPLHAPPANAAFTRRQFDTLPAAQAQLRGREIAYVADPLEALLIQIQGSGRLRLMEADGRVRTVRLAYAGHNGEPYRSVGRWLIDQGELRAGEASWPAIRDWARRNPRRLQEMLWNNPRVVFFKEEALPDPTVGPRGAQGVALTPGRSIAVDPTAVPYGTPVWLDTTAPLSSMPLRRLVMAQDTGSAIVGAVRADYFWGWGAEAQDQAGRMKQPLRLWVLWPRRVAAVTSSR